MRKGMLKKAVTVLFVLVLGFTSIPVNTVCATETPTKEDYEALVAKARALEFEDLYDYYNGTLSGTTLDNVQAVYNYLSNKIVTSDSLRVITSNIISGIGEFLKDSIDTSNFPSCETVDLFKVLFAYKGLERCTYQFFGNDSMKTDVAGFDNPGGMSETNFENMCSTVLDDTGYSYGTVLGAYSTMKKNLSNISDNGYNLNFAGGTVISESEYTDAYLVSAIEGTVSDSDALDYVRMLLTRTEVTDTNVVDTIINSSIGDIRCTNSYYVDDVVNAYELLRRKTSIGGVSLSPIYVSAKQFIALTSLESSIDIRSLTFDQLEELTGVYFDGARKNCASVADFFDTQVASVAGAYSTQLALASSEDGTAGKEEAAQDLQAFIKNIGYLSVIEDAVENVVIGDYSIDFTTRNIDFSIEALVKETAVFTDQLLRDYQDNDVDDEKTLAMMNLLYQKLIVTDETILNEIYNVIGVNLRTVAHEYWCYLSLKDSSIANVLRNSTLNPYGIDADQLYLFWKLNGTIAAPDTVADIISILDDYKIAHNNLNFPDGTTVSDILAVLNNICGFDITHNSKPAKVNDLLEMLDVLASDLKHVKYRNYTLNIINHCIDNEEMVKDGIIYGLTEDSNGNEAAEVIGIYCDMSTWGDYSYIGKNNSEVRYYLDKLPLTLDEICAYYVKKYDDVYENDATRQINQFMEDTSISDKEKAIGMLDQILYPDENPRNFKQICNYYKSELLHDCLYKGEYSYYELAHDETTLMLMFTYYYALNETENRAQYQSFLKYLKNRTHLSDEQLIAVLSAMSNGEYVLDANGGHNSAVSSVLSNYYSATDIDFSDIDNYYSSARNLFQDIVDAFYSAGIDFYTKIKKDEELSVYQTRLAANNKFIRGILNCLLIGDSGLKKVLEHYVLGNYEYNFLTGDITVHESCDRDLVIPDYVPGTNLKVVGIKEYACINAKTLNSVEFPKYIEYISNNAFEESGLEDGFSFRDGGEFCTYIGESAFYDIWCSDTIVIPDGIVKIGDYAFEEVSASEIRWPENMDGIIIGDGAFSGNNIKNLVIPEGVLEIGSYAFANGLMETMSIPASATRIGGPVGGAGGYCQNCLKSITVAEGNTAVKAEDGILYSIDGKKLIEYPGALAKGTVTVKEGVETLGSWAFEYCTNMTKLILPESLKYIEGYAIADCDYLTEITMSEVKMNGYMQSRNVSSMKLNIRYKTELTEGLLTVESDSTYNILGEYNGNERFGKPLINGNGYDIKLSAKDSDGNSVPLTKTSLPTSSSQSYSFEYLLSLIDYNPSFEISIPSEFDSTTGKMEIKLVSEYAEGEKFYIDMDSSNTFKLTDDDGEQLPFSLIFKKGSNETVVSEAGTGHAWEFDGSNKVAKEGDEEWVEVYVSVDEDDIRYSGTYKGTVTFSYGLSTE